MWLGGLSVSGEGERFDATRGDKPVAGLAHNQHS